ncbi:MAG TPA: UbiA family prenyltransferase [Candidatus Thermoplasmatota archaeon]
MGARGAAAGLLLEVRPLPMAAALLYALLGLAWAQGGLLPLHPAFPWLAASVFFGLYTAHLMDTYVDVVKRHDMTPDSFPLLFRDSSGLLPPRAYPAGMAVSAGLCAACAAVPVAEGGPAVALSLASGLALALSYAPLLDRRLLGVSLAYPAGALAAFTAGYALSAGAVDLRWSLLGLPVFVALVGTKVRSDVIDLADDARIGKRTVAVAFGERAALVGGYGLAFAGVAAAAALPWVAGVPPLLALPPAGAAAAMAATARMDAFRGSMAMAGSMFALLAAELAAVAAVGA